MLDTGSLTFLWPSMLWLLIAVPLAAALYWTLATRRRKSSAQYASLETRRARPIVPAACAACALLLWTLG